MYSYSDAVMPVTCETHGGRAIEYYCETDQVAICSQCALLGYHQGHKITEGQSHQAQLTKRYAIGSRHKDTDQCPLVAISFSRHRSVPVLCVRTAYAVMWCLSVRLSHLCILSKRVIVSHFWVAKPI